MRLCMQRTRPRRRPVSAAVGRFCRQDHARQCGPSPHGRSSV